jgi:biopolymer transport protein ExbD
MQQELANNAKIKEDGLVLVQGDENVPYERIVDVLKALQQAQIPDVGFVTDPDPKRLREQGQ